MIVRENGNGRKKEEGRRIADRVSVYSSSSSRFVHEGSPASPTDGRTILAHAVSRDDSI